MQQRRFADLCAHAEVALAHARGGGLEAFQLPPQRPRPAPQDHRHRGRHQQDDDGVVQHHVFVGAYPFDAQRTVGVLDAAQIHGSAPRAIAEGDLSCAQALLLGTRHEEVGESVLHRHDLVRDAEGGLDLLQPSLRVGHALVGHDALGAVEGHARALPLLLGVHLRHDLVGRVHQEHECHRGRQHEEEVEPEEEAEHARGSVSPRRRRGTPADARS
jgi:hypothetical protein